MTTIASATPGASRVPKAEVTGKLAAGWLTAAAVLADLGLGAGVAGDLLYGSGANTLARLPIATAGRVLVAGASAPAWSDSGLSYASGVLTVAGSVPGTPSSGQVMIGGGAVKAGTAVYGADGSAAAPGLRTTTYAHGLYSATSTILGFAVGGVAALQVTSPGGGIGAGLRSLTAADGDYCYFLSDRANAELRISAGNTTTNGANLQLFGSGHATASTGRLRVSGASVLVWTATSITAVQNLTVPNGTESAPGLRVAGEASGLYRVSSTGIGIAAAALPVARFYCGNGSTFGPYIQMESASAAEWAGILSTRTDSELRLIAGSSSTASAQLRLYGSTHATKADRVEFTRGATVSAYFDGSGNLTCNGAVTVAGAITHSGVNTASGSTAGRLAYFGGTSGDGAAFELRGSTYSGSPDTGFLRVGSTYVANWSTAGITLSTGALTVPNGTAAAPGLRTTTYAHGLHSIGATSVGIDVAGALVLTVGATASSFASGTTVQFSNTTTAGNGTGSVICNGGGYFAKAVFAANDASGVHYYGNSGLTMRDLGTGTSTYLDLAFGSASHGAYNIRSSNAATVRFNIDTSGHVTLGGTAGNYLNINNATGELRINGTKVSGPRDTGWTAMTGTTDKATAYDTATVTLPQLAGRVMALQAALTAHGKIGT